MDHIRFLARREAQIRIKLSEIFKHELANSTLSKITITRIVIDRSMDQAMVYYQPFPGEEIKLARELKMQTSNIRKKLVKSLSSKKCPILKFKYDQGVAHAAKIGEILNQLKLERENNAQIDQELDEDI